jgi:predicted RNA-binding Zn ribbon-like protein
VTAADLGVWGRRYGLLSRSVALDEGELERARAARELLHELFFARVHGRSLPKAALARLSEFATDAYRVATLEAGDDGALGWRWDRSELSTVRHVAITGAIELLRSGPIERVKRCPGDRCGWFFLDTTKRGNRRWCSMSECGQQAKNLRRRRPPA